MACGLLLLHGFTGGPSSWAPAEPRSSSGARALAPALVGHGDAAGAEAGDFEGEVDRIAALLEPERRWHVAGYSLGGRIALGLLVRHARLFSGATLIGAQPGLSTEDERRSRRAADERWCAMLATKALADFVTAWEAQPLFDSQRTLPNDVRARQRAERLAQNPQGLARSLRATGLGAMPSYWEALPDIRVPVALVAGERDEKFSSIAKRMRERLPSATLHIVPGAGHNVVLERPEFVRALLGRAVAGGVEP